MALRILHSIPSSISHSGRSSGGISVLLILDSSFNPPTKAHGFLLHQAIRRLRSVQNNHQSSSQRTSQHTSSQARILLLLSTKNADKPSAPASVEQRVDMMRAFAKGIWDGLLAEDRGASSTADAGDAHSLLVSGIDVGLSSEPRFLEKSVFLATPSHENPYSEAMQGQDEGVEAKESVAVPQWHLLGFDTLVRLLDGKYYEPAGSLDVLAPLFERQGNRVLVIQRGEKGNDQEEFVQQLSVEHDRGGFSGKGWDVDWARKVELIPAFDGVEHDGKMLDVSSTAVRRAAKGGDALRVQSMCDERVAEYVVQEGLYKE